MSQTTPRPVSSSPPRHQDQSARLAASAPVDQVGGTQLGDYFVPAGGVVLGTCIQVGVAYPFGSSGGGYFLSDEFGWAWWPTLGEMTSALASRILEQRA